MICELFQGLTLAERTLECLGSPAAAWAMPVALVVAAASLLLALRLRLRGWAPFLTATLFLLGALLLQAAAERPVLRDRAEAAGGGRIAVLVDGSESFWRSEGTSREALEQIAGRIDAFLQALPTEEAPHWRGELLSFGAALQAHGSEMSLANLSSSLRSFRPAEPAGASNLWTALSGTLGRLSDTGGRRMILLASDGHASDTASGTLLPTLRSAGVAVHVVAAGAEAPAHGLIAADIGPEHELGAPATIRGTVLGGGTLRVIRDDGTTEIAADPADHLRALRLDATFMQRGLQGVTLEFEAEDGLQGRTLFTLVRGPARVLVLGAAPWADALPPERWQVERADAMTAPDPGEYDLVIIDALSPAALPPDYPERLLAAANGTGIFLVNGGIRGTVLDEQLISDWSGTALNPILPVDSDPRLFVQEPPPRDVVIMVDVSGSMGGTRLWSAQSVINAILDQLRTQDTVTILPFASDMLRPFPQSRASADVIEAARRFTAGLTAGGGTAPGSTIQASAQFASNYCAFFFVSDNDFPPPRTNPSCFMSAISVSNRPYPEDVSQWGESILLGEGGDGRNIRLQYFEPEERLEYYREGRFRPLVVGSEVQPVPPNDVDGLAIAYARVDARIETVHSTPPPDPLFVWRRDARLSGVVTGVFLGPMGPEWGGQGLEATESMLSRLVGWSDQERYLLRIHDNGGSYQLSVTELGEQQVTGALAASLGAADGSTRSLSLQHDPRRGAHIGNLPVDPADAGSRALLVLQQGTEVQRIPLAFPARLSVATGGSEGLDHGINAGVMELVRAQTGGSDLDRTEIAAYALPVNERDAPIHQYLLALAFLSLALAVWTREVRGR